MQNYPGSVDFRDNRDNAMIVAVSIGVGMIPLIAPQPRQWSRMPSTR